MHTESTKKNWIKENENILKRKIDTIVKGSYGGNVQLLIFRLNWVLFQEARTWIDTMPEKSFYKIDYYILKKVYRFLRRSHPKKGWKWIKKQYFFQEETRKKWILTDPKTGSQLKKMVWFLKRGMLEPYVGKPTRTVLRRERKSNLSDLAGKNKRVIKY